MNLQPLDDDRILFLCPDLFGPPGGIARYCRMVCQAITDAGLSLRVLALNDPDAQEALHPLQGLDYRGCNGNRLSFVRGTLSSLRARPSLILVGHPNFAPLGWMAARLTGASMVVFLYGIDAWQPLPRLRRWVIAPADRLIAISRFTAHQAALVNGLPRENMRIVHNCLDPAFQPAVGRVDSSAGHRILTVARISRSEWYKGHDSVIRAMPALLARFPDLTYHIVGDGDGRPALEALAEWERVAGAVHFHGTVSEDELADHYEHASIFVMPSRAEGFGFVFLEAMAHGRPVIAGNRDASSEVVQHGETGLVVDPDSSVQLTDAIVRLLSDDGLRAQMGLNGKERVTRAFSFETFRRALLANLDEALAHRGAPKRRTTGRREASP